MKAIKSNNRKQFKIKQNASKGKEKNLAST